MSAKSEKEDLKLLDRFKHVICENCKCKGMCTEGDDHWYISCPKFFNFKYYGRGEIELSDYSYNVERKKDLRIES